MNLIDKMQGMSRAELVELARTQGVKVHWRAKEATIMKAIVESVTPTIKTEFRHEAEEAKAPVDHNTPKEVEAMLAPIKAKVADFTAIYNTDENTWHFRCKGAEECGNLDIPMRVIAMKARTVSRGRLALYGMNEHFDKTAATGKSAYTNTVLAG